MEFHARKRNRLPYYDYSTNGGYFVTICTEKRKNTLCAIVGDGFPVPKKAGQITEANVHRISLKFPEVYVDKYVIMPNHIHLIIIITDDEELRAIRESPLRGRSVISKVIGYVKMNASKEIHGKSDDAVIWQRGFHDHIIRDRRDYEKIAKYIYENPIRWQYDCFFAEE